MSLAYSDEREPKLIKDISVLQAGPYTTVRHQSISFLEHQYLRDRAYAESESRNYREKSMRAMSRPFLYTRIPPLLALHADERHKESFVVQGLWNRGRQVKACLHVLRFTIPSFFAALAWLTPAWLFGFYKKYTVDEGVHVSWNSKVVVHKWVPVFLLLLGIGLFPVVYSPTYRPSVSSGPGKEHRNPAIDKKTHRLTSNGTGTASGINVADNIPYAAPNQQINTPIAAAPSANLPAATGGGSNTLPLPAPSLPYTVVIPPVDSQVGGKRVLGTSGSAVTLN